MFSAAPLSITSGPCIMALPGATTVASLVAEPVARCCHEARACSQSDCKRPANGEQCTRPPLGRWSPAGADGLSLSRPVTRSRPGLPTRAAAEGGLGWWSADDNQSARSKLQVGGGEQGAVHLLCVHLLCGLHTGHRAGFGVDAVQITGHGSKRDRTATDLSAIDLSVSDRRRKGCSPQTDTV